MPQVVNEQVVDAATSVNAKNGLEMPGLTAAFASQAQQQSQSRVQEMVNANMNLALQSAQQVADISARAALDAQASWRTIQQAVTAKAARQLFDTSAEQATAFSKEISANLEEKLANIEGLLAAGQQQSKVAQSTAPQTGTGGAFGSDAGSALLQQLANIQALLQSLAEKIK